MNSLKAPKVIFFLFLLTSFFSCRNQNLPSEILLISLEKTPCFGTCPAYKLEIFSSGLVRFNGQSNHEMLGQYEAFIEKATLEKVIEEFRNSDFFNFKNQYTSKVMDVPTTYLYFKHQSNEKTIQENSEAPKKVKELEQLLENLVPELKWKKKD